jgi:hypothetical protein
MSRRRLRYLERTETRDERVPLSADDPEMDTGWSCIPVPPSADPRRFIPRHLPRPQDRVGTLDRLRDVEGTA